MEIAQTRAKKWRTEIEGKGQKMRKKIEGKIIEKGGNWEKIVENGQKKIKEKNGWQMGKKLRRKKIAWKG